MARCRPDQVDAGGVTVLYDLAEIGGTGSESEGPHRGRAGSLTGRCARRDPRRRPGPVGNASAACLTPRPRLRTRPISSHTPPAGDGREPVRARAPGQPWLVRRRPHLHGAGAAGRRHSRRHGRELEDDHDVLPFNETGARLRKEIPEARVELLALEQRRDVPTGRFGSPRRDDGSSSCRTVSDATPHGSPRRRTSRRSSTPVPRRPHLSRRG